jgi:predicted transglutaminase-like cysteine proteinase
MYSLDPDDQLNNGNQDFLLAFDTTGLVIFFNQSITRNGTGAPDDKSLTYTLVFPPQRHVIRDFNGDGKADILWRTGTGDFYLWNSTPGSAVVSFTGQDLGVTPSDWRIQDAADFHCDIKAANCDGKADILWRTGDSHVYLGPGVSFTLRDLGVPPSDWYIQDVADFNGDGKADILWRTGDGHVYLWNSTPPSSAVSFTFQDLGVPPSDWHIQDVADFNHDFKADILWRTDDGHLYLWKSTSGSEVSFTFQDLGVPPFDWFIQDVADFNGDGKADILWRTNDGGFYLWNSTPGSAVSFTGQDLGVPPSDWHIQGVADFNRDGKADILWRTGTGDFYLWNSIPGSAPAVSFTGQDLGAPPSDWGILPIGTL